MSVARDVKMRNARKRIRKDLDLSRFWLLLACRFRTWRQSAYYTLLYRMSVLPEGEAWKEIAFPDEKGPLKKYAVSDRGRVIAYLHNPETGRILKGGLIGGYPSVKVRIKGKDKTFYVHRLVGEYFLRQPDPDCDRLIHLDYDKRNNCIENLRWVTKSEALEHQRKNPAVIRAKKIQSQFLPDKGHKLTTTDVIRIKKKIWDPNRKTRLKMIAKQFGISEMQLYRIKSGENWSHIRVENEPDHTRKKQPGKS